jgi:spermidine/putrescine transport system permease protein
MDMKIFRIRIQQKVLPLLGWLYLSFMFVFLFLPLITLIVFSFENNRFPTLPWTGWTLEWYISLLNDRSLFNALQSSLVISPLAATAASVLGFLTAYALNRFDFPGKMLFSGLLVVPTIVPPLIMGVAFLGLLSRLNLQGQALSVFLCHVVILLPLAIAVIALRLSQMPSEIEEAAWNLGANQWQSLGKVVVPWALPSIVGGWLLAFTFSFDEFIIAWFVCGFDRTLPVAIYDYMGSNLDPSLNAIGSIVLLVSLILLIGVELVLIPFLFEKNTE